MSQFKYDKNQFMNLLKGPVAGSNHRILHRILKTAEGAARTLARSRRCLAVGLCLGFALSAANAAEFAVEGGFRNQSGDATAVSNEASSKTAFQLGGAGSFEISGPLSIRTGMFYTQRPLGFQVGTVEGTYSINYFDVPVGLQYKFEDYFSVWAGAGVAVKLDSKCEIGGATCPKVKEKDMVVPLTLGTSFKFAPQLGASVFFEMISGELTDSTEDYRAVGANLSFYFE